MVERTCHHVFRLLCCPDYCWHEKQPVSSAWSSPPSTVLTVNISNCTLNNCIIGNDVNTLTVAQELRSCNCSHGQQVAAQPLPPLPSLPRPSAEPLYINISDSDLKWVIIGNNNTMCTRD